MVIFNDLKILRVLYYILNLIYLTFIKIKYDWNFELVVRDLGLILIKNYIIYIKNENM